MFHLPHANRWCEILKKVLSDRYVQLMVKFGFMVFNATFNNISVISWRSVLLVEKTINLLQVTESLSYNSTPLHE
jgi:hypothetical protein